MVKVSKLFEWIIAAVLLILLRYAYMVPALGIKSHIYLYYVLITAMGIFMALYVSQVAKNNTEMRRSYWLLNKYIPVYSVIMVISILATVQMYGYSIKEILFVASSYGFIFYCYPLVYILNKRRSWEKYIERVLTLVIIMLMIKALVWFLYTYTGAVVFPDLLFEYGTWSRSGVHRVEAGYLFGLALVYYLSNVFHNRKRLRSLLIVIGLFLYMIFVTRFRFQLIVMIAVSFIVYYYSTESNKKKTVRILLLCVALGAFVGLGGLDKVLESFSLTGQNAGSTLLRIETIDHYWKLLLERRAFWGLGLLDSSNDYAHSLMMFTNRDRLSYINDIGMLGGIFRFGVMSLPLYGCLFYQAIKVCQKYNKSTSYRERSIVIGIVAYMIISCIMLNIFDLERAFNLPFDLAILSFLNANAESEHV